MAKHQCVSLTKVFKLQVRHCSHFEHHFEITPRTSQRIAASNSSFVWYLRSIMRNITMKQQDKKEKQKNRRQTLHRLCSGSGLLLSVVCCTALIHVELKIQEHHRLISHSVTFCDNMETEILRKVGQNYRRWQVKTDTTPHGTKGWFYSEPSLSYKRMRVKSNF